MTLILSALTPTHAIQVSDRRLTLPNGELYEDDRNKALALSCSNGHFCLSATGLGVIRGKPTSEWMADTICAENQGRFRLVDILRALKAGLDEVWRSQRKGLPLTIVGVGVDTTDDTTVPVHLLISNCEPADHFRGETGREFAVAVRGLPIGQPISIEVQGCRAAVKDQTADTLNWALRHYRHPNEIGGLMSAFVKVIRMASHDPQLGRFIGRNCMGLYVPHLRHSFKFDYYPENGSPYSQAPPMVSKGMSMSHMVLWQGEMEDWPAEFPMPRPPERRG